MVGGGSAAPEVRLTPMARRVVDGPELSDWLKQEAAERSLWDFTRQLWRWIDPAPFRDNWHIGCIAEHLEAVTRGEIHRLLINIPPRVPTLQHLCDIADHRCAHRLVRFYATPPPAAWCDLKPAEPGGALFRTFDRGSLGYRGL